MRLKISIYWRLVFWITLLVLLLVGAVLFVIQRREAAILSADAEARAVLIAENLGDANYDSLFGPTGTRSRITSTATPARNCPISSSTTGTA